MLYEWSFPLWMQPSFTKKRKLHFIPGIDKKLSLYMPVLTCTGQNNLHVQDVYFGVTYFDSGTLQPIVKWGLINYSCFCWLKITAIKKYPNSTWKEKVKILSMTEKSCLVQWTQEKCIDHGGSSQICLIIKLFVHIKCILFHLCMCVFMIMHMCTCVCVYMCVWRSEEQPWVIFSDAIYLLFKGSLIELELPKAYKARKLHG